MGTTIVEVLQGTVEYISTAYLTQVAHQAIENSLARGDLRKAIQEKCGSAGAANTADLEKQILQPNPMSPSHVFRIPGTNFRFPTSDLGVVRFPWLRQWPIFPVVRNPYMLFTAGMYEWGERLDANQEGGGKWAAMGLLGSFFLADAQRGFRILDFAPFNRVPSIRIENPNFRLGERFSQRFNHIHYSDHLRGVTANIQCNEPPPPEGGLPEPDPVREKVDTDPMLEMAPEPEGVIITADDAVAIPGKPNGGQSLARQSLRIYGGAQPHSQLAGPLFGQGIQTFYSSPIIVMPLQAPLTLPTFSAPAWSALRPILVP